MKTKLIAALFGAALWTHAHAAPGCPGGATWCDGFEDGSARWTTTGTVGPVREGPGNGVMRLGPDAAPASREAVAPVAAPWFVEARMRALGAAGQSYVLARYLDEHNWLGAGIDVTPGSPKVNVVIARMQDGQLTRLKQWGKESLPDGAFYTVRLALAGGELTLYLNGERLTTASEPSMPGGRIGLPTRGADFELDDVRVAVVGTAPGIAPGRIGLARVNNRISLQAGDPARRYLVNADGRRAPAATATSSDPALVSAAMDGDALVVTARRPGRATVGVASGADRNVAAWLGVSVGPKFAPQARGYPSGDRFSPAATAAEVPVDTLLRIRFDRRPVLGTGGSVRIFRAADDALVDAVNVGDELDVMGARRQAFKRVVRRKLIGVDGDSATVRPHSSSLAYDTAYYRQVDPGVFTQATLGGVPFTGLGAQAEALNFNSGGRLVAKHASFWSEQDTIQVKGYSWFYRSLIAGNVDFIWSGNRAALFEESEIRSLGDSASANSGGYIVQARTLGANDPGFVFLNSRLTHGPGPAGNDVPPETTWLARPGTPQSHDKVSYINCRVDTHIAPGGWSLPRTAHAGAGVGWSEYGSMDASGAPLDLSRRAGGRTLTAAQVAAALTHRAQVFAGFDHGRGWNPQPHHTSMI